MSDIKIRETRAEDIPALQLVVELTDMFPPHALPGMLTDFLSGNANDVLWLTCEWEGRAVGLCYGVPEQLTDGTWNMLTLAVHPDQQGKGVGTALVAAMEAKLREEEQRILIVETSGTDDFILTRQFYRKLGYRQEAVIHDFWADGADKIIFWKSLV